MVDPKKGTAKDMVASSVLLFKKSIRVVESFPSCIVLVVVIVLPSAVRSALYVYIMYVCACMMLCN